MKKFIALLALSSSLTACGIADQIASDCGGHFKQLCQAIFGETPAQVDELQDEVHLIKEQIAALEAQNIILVEQILDAVNNISLLEAQSAALSALISSLQAQDGALQSQIDALEAQHSGLTTIINNTTVNLSSLESSVAQNVTQIAVLNGFTHVTEIVDPCGDHPTKFDEVLLRIYRPASNSYAILASFSDNASGLNTRFSIVPTGSFQTTDGTNCAFQVGPAPGFTVTW